MDKEWVKVKEFHSVFGHPISDNLLFLKGDRVEKRVKWMREEIDEFVDAKDLCEQVDAIIDLIYFALGTFVEMGVKPDEYFQIVHDANMSKLGEDNKPIYNSDGKTIKPIGWVDPYEKINLAIERNMRQINQTVLSKYKYDLEIAEPYACVPAVLKMVLGTSRKSVSVTQEQIKKAIGVNVPQTDNDGQISISEINTNDYGVLLTKDYIERFINIFSLPYTESFISIYSLSDWEFEEKLEELLTGGNHAIVAYDYGVLHGYEGNSAGHVSLVVGINKQSDVTIIDPGPEHAGEKTVKAYDLYRAIHAKKSGIQVLKEHAI